MSTERMYKLLLLVLGECFLIAGPTHAQTYAEITGVVTDPSGGAIVGATVTISRPQTGFTRQATTNNAGNYNFPSLLPGPYNVRASAQGFQSAIRNDIELQVQQVARVDFTLNVGTVTETVEVAGGAIMLSTENATVGTVIDNRRIVEMPLNGRNFLQLVALSPNVSAGFANAGQSGARQGGSRANQQLSVAGNRREFNHFTLDGVENTDVNFNTYVFLPSIDALQEFKVQSGIFPAEFGRATAQVNVSTKSGTNDFHGTIFEFLRNDKLDAENYAFTTFRPPKDPFKWNQYGFTLGGPVWIPKFFNGRNRLFFMSNFEGYRDRKTLRGTYSVPSAAMRQGDFSEVVGTARIYDPTSHVRGADGKITATPFSNNLIPPNLIHATSVKLLEFYPAPNVNVGSLASNYQIGRNRRIDKDQFNERIDFIESSKASWFGRYSWGDEQEITPDLKLNGTNLLNHVWQAMLSNTRVLRPDIVNEFRFGYNDFFNSYGRELAFTRDVVGELKIPGLLSPAPVAWGIPSIGITGFNGFGDDSEGPYVNRNHTFQWIDNLSWIHGNHALRFGGEIRRDRYNQLGNQFARGSFGFQGLATQNPASPPGTGYGFADYMLGYTQRAEASVALAVAQFRTTSQAYYIDDSWKIRPNLTVNLGLRYEFTPPWYDKGLSLVNIYVPYIDTVPQVPDLNRHPTFVRAGSGDFYEGKILRFNPAIQVARDGRLGDRLIASDYKNFAPRLGLAWSPTNKWTIRTGAGLFYAQDTGNPRFDMERNFAGRRRDELNADFPDLNWSQPFRNLGGTVQIDNPYVLGNDYGRFTPYSIQYTLNIQRQLDEQTMVELGYLGSVSHKLERMYALNEALARATGSVISRSPYAEFGRIQEIGNRSDANYNSLEVRVQRRFAQGLTYLAGYTYSKSIDYGSGIRTLGSDPLFPQNSYCIRCERGLSVFDVRHRLITSTLYELPTGKGKRFLNSGGPANLILGGWALSSIIGLNSGFPLTVTTGGRAQSNNGAGADRPNATGATVALPRGRQDPEQFFNISAFELQPFGTFGNTGRNTLIGPGMITWDFSTLKTVPVRERQSLEFRFEAFNLPNHPNWGDPTTGFVSVNFGKIRSTRISMRELQFALKYIF